MKAFLNKFLETYKNMKVQSKAAIWYAICNVIQKGIVFLTTPIFSRLLTTEEYGIFSVFVTWQSIIIIFASLNLASGVYLRGLIKYEEDEEEFSTSLYSLFSLVFILVFALYLGLSGFWNRVFDLPTDFMICMFADMLVSTAFHFWSARQRVLYEYRQLIVVTIINAITKPLFGVIAILVFSDNIAARIYSMTIVDVACFGYFFVTMFAKKKKKISTKYWKYALVYNIPLVPHYLSQIILNQSDRVMIKKMTGASDAGIYSLAYTFASIMGVLNQAVLNSYNPWMYRQIKDKKYDEIGKYSVNLLGLIALGNLLVIIFAPELIAIMAPASYQEAVYIMPPVTMSVYFTFLYSLFSNFEFYYEKTKFMMVASVSGAALNVLLNYIFIGKFGYFAAGYTTLICYLCYCIAHYIVMRIILNKELNGMKIYDMRLIMGLSVGFVLCGFVFMMLYSHTLIRYCVIVLILCALFVKRKALMGVVANLKK